MDIVVEDLVVVEIKSVEVILPVHEAQLLTYLRLSKCPVGLLINFNVRLLKEGLTRRVLTPADRFSVGSPRSPRSPLKLR
jgi:GxxExxY protein